MHCCNSTKIPTEYQQSESYQVLTFAAFHKFSGTTPLQKTLNRKALPHLKLKGNINKPSVAKTTNRELRQRRREAQAVQKDMIEQAAASAAIHNESLINMVEVTGMCSS